MSAKVQWYREAWWVMTHWNGKRRRRRVGPTKDQKREAEEIARKINGALALGTFQPEPDPSELPLPCDAELQRWLDAHAVTMKPGYEATCRGLVERHLKPFFGAKDLREIREEDLLRFVRLKLEAGLSPATIRNALAALRRACSLLVRAGRLDRNPAIGVGEILRRVQSREAVETRQVEAWSPEEVQTLVGVAREGHSPFLYPLLVLLLGTGVRRGEALGLKWADVDFSRGRIAVRRSWSAGNLGTPKSGRARTVALPPGVASTLLDHLARARCESLAHGRQAEPEWVFASEGGGLLDERNVVRAWARVRRRAQKRGVRPLKLHAARHTYATLALRSGKSLRWVAGQLGHHSPNVTLDYYLAALREEEEDLSFADFTVNEGPGRPYTAPAEEGGGDSLGNPANPLVELAGIEPATLRLPA